MQIGMETTRKKAKRLFVLKKRRKRSTSTTNEMKFLLTKPKKHFRQSKSACIKRYDGSKYVMIAYAYATIIESLRKLIKSRKEALSEWMIANHDDPRVGSFFCFFFSRLNSLFLPIRLLQPTMLKHLTERQKPNHIKQFKRRKKKRAQSGAQLYVHMWNNSNHSLAAVAATDQISVHCGHIS